MTQEELRGRIMTRIYAENRRMNHVHRVMQFKKAMNLLAWSFVSAILFLEFYAALIMAHPQ